VGWKLALRRDNAKYLAAALEFACGFLLSACGVAHARKTAYAEISTLDKLRVEISAGCLDDAKTAQ
jgi:hypothetical protein